MFDVIGKRNWFFAFSLLITIPGLIFLLLGPVTGGKVGLQFAIDFTGGTVWTIRFEDENVTPEQVQEVVDEPGLRGLGHQDRRRLHRDPDQGGGPRRARAVIAPVPSAAPSASPDASASARPPSGHRARRIRQPRRHHRPAPAASRRSSVGRPRRRHPAPSRAATCRPPASWARCALALEEELGPIVEQQSLSAVGAVVSSDLITQALTLIFFGAIGIMLWITYRFRDFKMGVTALIALLHDVLVVVGAFAILGTFTGMLIDGLFVTAMLTVIGFSVHDTIVVFDRVRENRARHVGEPFDRIVNHSILQTFGRSITTSLTVVITLLALLLFAGDAIGTFVLALLLGIISGTYSSIFNASPAPRRLAPVGGPPAAPRRPRLARAAAPTT